jgi:hypothetical protein
MGAGERFEVSVRDPDLARNAMKFSGRTCRKLGHGGVVALDCRQHFDRPKKELCLRERAISVLG